MQLLQKITICYKFFGQFLNIIRENIVFSLKWVDDLRRRQKRKKYFKCKKYDIIKLQKEKAKMDKQKLKPTFNYLITTKEKTYMGYYFPSDDENNITIYDIEFKKLISIPWHEISEIEEWDSRLTPIYRDQIDYWIEILTYWEKRAELPEEEQSIDEILDTIFLWRW